MSLKETISDAIESHIEWAYTYNDGRIDANSLADTIVQVVYDPHEKELYKAAMWGWGPETQREMLAEECSELAVAVNHYKRGRIDVDALCEEIADVEIMIGQMRIMYSSLIDEIKTNKLSRLEKRLRNIK